MPEEKKDGYLKKIMKKDINIYFDAKHKNMKDFVEYFEKCGIKRTSIKNDFNVVVLQRTGAIVEIVGVDGKTNELIVNTVFDEKGKFAGQSYVLKDD